jgi:hypothetical protein
LWDYELSVLVFQARGKLDERCKREMEEAWKKSKLENEYLILLELKLTVSKYAR